MKKIVYILIVFSILIMSCSKESGEGGTSSIQGKILAKYYDKGFTKYIGTEYVPEKWVYIIYGDDVSYGDRKRTNYDGTYEFKYLRKGKYKVFVYSVDSTLTIPSQIYPVITDIEITKNSQTIHVPDMLIFDNP